MLAPTTAGLPATSLREAAAGAAAGAVGTVLGFPLDTVKSRLQATPHASSGVAVARELLRAEGARGFFRGLAPPLLSMTALNVLSFEGLKQSRAALGLPPLAPPEQRTWPAPGSVATRFLAGCAVTPLVTFVSTPFELLKLQAQLQGGPAGVVARAATITRTHGVLALWHGGGVNLVRESLFLGAYFTLYESGSGALLSVMPPPLAVPLAGGFAGALAWGLSLPFDAIKTRVQGQPLAQLGTHAEVTARGAAAALLRAHGVAGLFTGLGPSALRAFVVSGTRFAAYEAVMGLLRPPAE